MTDRQAGPAHAIHSEGGIGDKVFSASGLSLSLPQKPNDQRLLAAEASPNACIASKQRMQLDLFLQSSTSK